MVSYCLKLGQKWISLTMSAYFQFPAPEQLLMLFHILLLLFEMKTPHLCLPVISSPVFQTLKSVVIFSMKPYFIPQIDCDLFLLWSP